MLTRSEMIACLKENLKIEEKALPIYSQHLQSTLFFSSFSQNDKDKIVNVIKTLQTESLGHKKVYETLIQKIEESDKDVY